MKKSTRLSLNLAVTYTVLGGLWISLSDTLVEMFAPDFASLARFQTYKGWFYVLVTAILVYVLVKRTLNHQTKIEDELRESEERWHFALEGAGDGVWDWNPQTDESMHSKRWKEMLGYAESEFPNLGAAWIAHLHPEDKERVLSFVEGCFLTDKSPFAIEYRMRCKDGSWKWMLARGMLVSRDQAGKPLRLIGTHTDITERKKFEDQIRKLSQAVEQSSSSIVMTDLDANITYVNATFTKNNGYTLAELLGKNPRVLQSGKTPKHTYDELWRSLTSGKSWQGEFVNHRKDGSEYTDSALISPVRDEHGKVTSYLSVQDDITEKKQSEERMAYLAHFDLLTGLPNRTLLQDHFKYALSLAQRNEEHLAVMFLDLDHFKNINDTLGHSVGDQLLMEVSKRFRLAMREGDTVSRLGGDEFIFILSGTDANGAAFVAEKLIEVVSTPFLIDRHELISTPSIGIAIYPEDGKDMEVLSQNADAAMYQAKQSGRNGFRFFTQAMQVNSARNLRLGNDLRHALARDQLQLLYQPQLAMQDGRLIGAEALLRWQHPELGMITPDEFIPIAENTGLIIPIGEWVLRTAVAQMKIWFDQGRTSMVMAVNLSAVQFRHTNLLNMVTGILAELGLPPENLELELTEAVAMDDPLAAIAVMDSLYERGIRMSIDDFGTGYSSLSYLKRFKAYKLKIDQSFVRDIPDDSEDKAIVTAIINLASSLGMHTIAEGVESASQLAFLRMQGCDEVQGYYFSKPLSSADFEVFVHNMH